MSEAWQQMVPKRTGTKPLRFQGLSLCSRPCLQRVTRTDSWTLPNSPMRKSHPILPSRVWRRTCADVKSAQDGTAKKRLNRVQIQVEPVLPNAELLRPHGRE